MTGPNGQATTFEYDATWAAAAAPRTGGPHLYLAGHEITANDAGTRSRRAG